MKTILAYVPVIHQGYIDFFKKYSGPGSVLYVFGRELIEKFDFFRKDIRALEPENTAKAIKILHILGNVVVADSQSLELFVKTKRRLIMPDEDVSRALADECLAGCQISFDSIFLRWDKKSSLEEKTIVPDRVTSPDGFVQEFMHLAEKESKRSSDWWRHIGAVAARGDDFLIIAHNRHVPSPQMPYVFGDPRSYFKKGINIEVSSAFHAEASVIATAASKGISLFSADLYTTTFPCPPCAKLIAYSGVKRVFFREGYSMLDAQNILRAKGIEVIRVGD